jgi:uncharacterized protein (TIGR00730 family)
MVKMGIDQLICLAGGSPHHDILADLIHTVLRSRTLERGDLKILLRALRELRYAFNLYARYRHVRKVTVFGSARTQPSAPIYGIARAFAERIARADFMVITGAGDGIMKAAQEGAGRDHSFGLNILLPFEQNANEIIVNDPKLVYLKYFFTRKLLFVKETDAVVLFPGGFGTHDEGYEALTLMQTGKSTLMPLVFLEAPGSTYWQDWRRFVTEHMLGEGLISPADVHLFTVTSDVDAAVEEIVTFYRNYHSSRYVNGQLVLRMHHALSEATLTVLNREFRDILSQGEIVADEATGDDATEFPHMPRLRLWFNRTNFGRLRQLINIINADATCAT